MLDNLDHKDVRASFERFPSWTQHFWTWFTGKALPYQKPYFVHTWWSYCLVTLSIFICGLSISSLAIVLQFDFWWVALVSGWFLTLNGARTMILVIAHQCIHGQFSGNRKLDDFIGELVTILVINQDAEAFRLDHVRIHHRRATFATVDDPPVKSLIGYGFLPGMSKRMLWRRAAWVVSSPFFHWKAFEKRLRSNLTSRRMWRRPVFLAYAAGWLSLAVLVPDGWMVVLFAFGVPVGVFLQISALMDNLGEHAWLEPPEPKNAQRHYHVSRTWARFCGRALPDLSLPVWRRTIAWMTWSLEMALYHFPARVLVVVGDLPNHDFHHRFPATSKWMYAAYARQQDIDKGHEGSPSYIEIWGLGQAMDQMFQALSKAAPLPRPTGPGSLEAEKSPSAAQSGALAR